MANIPVERKGGTPAWLWPLILLLLLALLFFFFAPGCGDDVDPAVLPADTVVVVTPAEPEPTGELLLDGPVDVSDVGTLFDRLEGGSILGALVRLDDVVADDVTGDSTFYVADSSGGRHLLVVLEGLGESEVTGGPSDGRYAIRDGDALDVMGRITTLPATFRDRYQMLESASSEYYLRARRVDN